MECAVGEHPRAEPLIWLTSVVQPSDAKYDEAAIHLREDDSLTLYTDGVIEAQSETGELYGFERAAALAASNPTVEEIVDAACAFGQKDDITVLRLVRLPQTAPAHTATIRIAAQIAGA